MHCQARIRSFYFSKAISNTGWNCPGRGMLRTPQSILNCAVVKLGLWLKTTFLLLGPDLLLFFVPFYFFFFWSILFKALLQPLFHQKLPPSASVSAGMYFESPRNTAEDKSTSIFTSSITQTIRNPPPPKQLLSKPKLWIRSKLLGDYVHKACSWPFEPAGTLQSKWVTNKTEISRMMR